MARDDLPYVPGALRALARRAARGEDRLAVARDLRTVADRIEEAMEEKTR